MIRPLLWGSLSCSVLRRFLSLKLAHIQIGRDQSPTLDPPPESYSAGARVYAAGGLIQDENVRVGQDSIGWARKYFGPVFAGIGGD
ncbi:MAG: hypothetical protein H6667_21190 [Ardenticatenaceae bacterium]|nr:hypothetical protein [Ardenticatenaceae bacterium]MCB9445062.1 hypothetical protein [Ardenticatenaceae bacterium]